MPVLKCEFDVPLDNMILQTRTNGDRIEIRGIHLGEAEAANLAQLVNSSAVLHVVIKKKGE